MAGGEGIRPRPLERPRMPPGAGEVRSDFFFDLWVRPTQANPQGGLLWASTPQQRHPCGQGWLGLPVCRAACAPPLSQVLQVFIHVEHFVHLHTWQRNSTSALRETLSAATSLHISLSIGAQHFQTTDLPASPLPEWEEEFRFTIQDEASETLDLALRDGEKQLLGLYRLKIDGLARGQGFFFPCLVTRGGGDTGHRLN